MSNMEIAEIVGIIAFSLSGFIIAAQDRLDLLGVLISSFLTALGGGIIRDTIAGRVPYTFSNALPGVLVVLTIAVSLIFKLYKKSKIFKNHYFVVSDSIGLISFSLSGALVGVSSEFNLFGVVFLGFTTAVGGGILRDTLLNRVPVVLVSELYGTIAVLIGGIIYLLDNFKLLNQLSILILAVVGLVVRLFAYYLKWHLPKLESIE